MEYSLFQTTYTDKKTGETRQSPTLHVHFRDHLNRRQRFTGGSTEKAAHAVASHLVELVECRKSGRSRSTRLERWLDTLPHDERTRLVGMDLIDEAAENAAATLTEHVEGRKDEAGNVTEPGYRQALAARGVTPAHVNLTVKRVADTFTACGFVTWRDLIRPGAAAKIEVWLGGRREKGEITGATAGYYVREVRGFCKWMKEQGKAPSVALEALKPPKNAEADSEQRRALSVEEMRHLLAACAADAPERCGLTGDDRGILYRFAFESGIRPGQIRALTVASFDLKADPPTVTSHAKFVKRRRQHVQILRPALTANLRERFKAKLPAAAAFTMPSKFHMAEMLRKDLADARARWIGAATNDEDREERQRSDFLAAVNSQGERAVFYSTRHGHGTALANAGVPEKDIAASMHHASRKTTTRYIHSGRKALKSAIEAMPDLSYDPARQTTVATGTDGVTVAPDAVACTDACTSGRSPVDSGGVDDPVFGAENEVSTGKTIPGRGGMADATDLKSDSRPLETPRNPADSEVPPGRLHKACTNPPADPDSAALLALLPRLSLKQRRQLLALAQSMVE